MELHICKDYNELSEHIADWMVEYICKTLSTKESENKKCIFIIISEEKVGGILTRVRGNRNCWLAKFSALRRLPTKRAESCQRLKSIANFVIFS